MDNYLIDREALSQFVDELIKKKLLPVDSTEELDSLREKAIKALDDKINTAIFGRLTDEQDQEINQLLDRNEEDPEVFKEFFNRAGLNLEEIITDAMQDFSKKFLEEGEV